MNTNDWNLPFISKEDFYEHVKQTVRTYRMSMEAFDLNRLNSNIVDPIKLLLDKSVYRKSWEDIIEGEIFRQRDKSNNNSIGYFHQRIFSYIEGCEVPNAGWDVIYKNPEGIQLDEGSKVHTLYIEMKNKHNTMNSASATRTYNKCQEQLLADDDCACLLVEAIAKSSQNIPWTLRIGGQPKSHRLIRRVSMDRFYQLVTGDPFAFRKVCLALPEAIGAAIDELGDSVLPHDTAFEELEKDSETRGVDFIDALYNLAFSSYNGFSRTEYGVISLEE